MLPFKKTIFDNGLTVLSERHTQYRSLSLGIWIKIGTRHESLSVSGVSHFLEHMLFKGTKTRTALQIAREVDQVGGDFNAFTSREHTCFHLLLLDRDWNLGVDILTDVLMNSQFKQEEFERERSVVLQEITMVEESPEELAHDLFFEKVYAQHGLGRPILGTQSSIKKLSRKDLVQFFNTYYRPDQSIFSIAGDVSHESVIKKLKALTRTSWPGRKSQSRPRPSLNAPVFKKGFWWIERPTEQVHLIWGVPGPHYASEDRFAAFLLNVYLGGGMSSTLFQEIREKNGLAYTVYSNLSPFVDSGVFSIYAATGLDQVALCLKLIEKCVENVRTQLLPKKELRIIQDCLKGTILLSSDSVEARMSSIAKNDLFLGRYVSIKEVCAQIDAITSTDLRRVANLIFKDDHRSILALGPKPTKALKKLVTAQ